MSETLLRLTLVAVLIPSVVLHEIAHGWVADRFGDPTARNAGRISLNPIRHVDPFGTLVLPIMLAMTAPFVVGYAKPVPVQPANLRNPRLHMLLVAFAGPASNFAIALAAIAAFRVIRPEDQSTLWFVLALTSVVNVVLGIFNLLPIPPLDGSAIIEFVLPTRWLPGWFRVRRYSFVLLLGFFLFFRSSLDPIFEWAVDLWRAQQ